VSIAAAEKPQTFQTKNGDNFVAITFGVPEGVVTFIPETDWDEFKFIGFSGDVHPLTMTVDEFNDAFRRWIPSLAARKAEKKRKKIAARERFDSFKDDYEEALKINLLVDASRGGDIDNLMERLDAILGAERKKTKKARSKVQKAYEEGLKKGKAEGFQSGYDYPKTSLEGTGFHDYMDS